MCNMMSTFLSIFDDHVVKQRSLMPHRCKICPRYFHDFHLLKLHARTHRRIGRQHQIQNGRKHVMHKNSHTTKKLRTPNLRNHCVEPSLQQECETKWGHIQSAIQSDEKRAFQSITKIDNKSALYNGLCNDHFLNGAFTTPSWKEEAKYNVKCDGIKVKQEILSDEETQETTTEQKFYVNHYQGQVLQGMQDSNALDLRIKHLKGDDVKVKQMWSNSDMESEHRGKDQDSLNGNILDNKDFQMLPLDLSKKSYKQDDDVAVKEEVTDDSEVESNQNESADEKEDFENGEIPSKCNPQSLVSINPAKYYFSRATPYRCLYCSKSFSMSANRLIHQRAHLKDPFPWVCNTCCKKFRSRVALKVHTRIHTGEKPYGCPFCDSKFSTKGYLNVHVRGHTGELPYKCEFCGKCFRESCKLTVHLRTHTLEKPYKCRFCDNTFSQRGNCRKHERIHTGEKPFKCCQCDKEYTNFRNFKRHEEMHTGVSAYRCSYCTQSFKFRRSLKTHEKIHTGGPVVVCVHCKGTYSSPSNLKRHMKDVHGDDQYSKISGEASAS